MSRLALGSLFLLSEGNPSLLHPSIYLDTCLGGCNCLAEDQFATEYLEESV